MLDGVAPAPDGETDELLAVVERAWRAALHRFWLIAGPLILLAAIALVAATGAPAARAELGAFAVGMLGLVWGGWLRIRGMPRSVLLSAAASELSRGRVSRAERIASHLAGRVLPLADGAAGRRAAHGLPREVAALHAEIALARGDAHAASRAFQAAIEASRGAAEPGGAPLVPSLHLVPALRAGLAVAHALAGDDDAALAAATTTRKTVELRAYGRWVVVDVATVKALLGRAALAEVIVASRSADPSRLEALLASARTIVLEATSPRERALFRALQRMARARVPPVYRRPASPALADDDATPRDWVATVVPAAAPFAQGRALVAAEVTSDADPDPTGPIGPAPGTTGDDADRSRGRLLFGARVIAFAVIAAALGLALLALVRDPRDPFDPVHRIGVVGLLLFAAGTLVAIAIRRGVAATRGANEAFSRAATTPPGVARAVLEPLDTSRAAARIGAMKEIALARIARESGAFQAALAHGDGGLRALARGVSARDAGVRAEVQAERALAFAALGRAAEAHAALAATPAYFAQRAALAARVELFIALRRGADGPRTLENARAIARTIGEHVWLDRRSELLVDLLRASGPTGGLGLLEDDRIRAELDEAGARAFLDALSPSLGALVSEAIG